MYDSVCKHVIPIRCCLYNSFVLGCQLWWITCSTNVSFLSNIGWWLDLFREKLFDTTYTIINCVYCETFLKYFKLRGQAHNFVFGLDSTAELLQCLFKICNPEIKLNEGNNIEHWTECLGGEENAGKILWN